MEANLKREGKKVTITAVLTPAEIDPWEKALRKDKPYPDCKEDDVLHTLTFKFGDGIEADIKVCNGDTGPWVDSVLFREGSEVQVLEPSDSLAGEYPFEYSGRQYMLTIERA